MEKYLNALFYPFSVSLNDWKNNRSSLLRFRSIYKSDLTQPLTVHIRVKRRKKEIKGGVFVLYNGMIKSGQQDGSTKTWSNSSEPSNPNTHPHLTPPRQVREAGEGVEAGRCVNQQHTTNERSQGVAKAINLCKGVTRTSRCLPPVPITTLPSITTNPLHQHLQESCLSFRYWLH